MKKSVPNRKGHTLFAAIVVALLLFSSGCGLIPGVDYPFDEAAFWNPDIPDYADDGVPYSYTMLASVTVFDYSRFLQNIQVVANFATQIQNQILNLQTLGTDLSGFSERIAEIQETNQQMQGSMRKEKQWNQIFVPVLELQTGQKDPSMQDMKNRMIDDNRTYQDAVRQAIMSVRNARIQGMIHQIGQQNMGIAGNNQGKQNANQAYGAKALQQIELNQNTSSMAATVITQEQRKIESNATASHNALGVHMNVSDPYHPKKGEPERTSGNGFVKF